MHVQSCCFANQTYCFFDVDVLAAVAFVIAKAPIVISVAYLRARHSVHAERDLEAKSRGIFASGEIWHAQLSFFSWIDWPPKIYSRTSITPNSNNSNSLLELELELNFLSLDQTLTETSYPNNLNCFSFPFRIILGDPGADSGDEGMSKRVGKYGTKKSKERREESLGTMS